MSETKGNLRLQVGPVSVHDRTLLARTPLRSHPVDGGVDAFAASAARGDTVGLEDGALLLAAHAQHAAPPGWPLPGLLEMQPFVDRVRTELDQLAAEVRASSADAPTVETLVAHLFGSCGFAGNPGDYYDPANSDLGAVLERRVGNPITLSVMTIAVAHRVGLTLHGVGMPAHFLVRTDEAIPRWIDPFGAGTIMSFDDVRAFFAQLSGGRTPFHPSYAEATPIDQVLGRMLANLQAIYFQRRSAHDLAWVASLSSALPATRPGAVSEAGRQMEELGQFKLAGRVLDACAKRLAGQDRENLGVEAQRLWARMN